MTQHSPELSPEDQQLWNELNFPPEEQERLRSEIENEEQVKKQKFNNQNPGRRYTDSFIPRSEKRSVATGTTSEESESLQ